MPRTLPGVAESAPSLRKRLSACTPAERPLRCCSSRPSPCGRGKQPWASSSSSSRGVASPRAPQPVTIVARARFGRRSRPGATLPGGHLPPSTRTPPNNNKKRRMVQLRRGSATRQARRTRRPLLRAIDAGAGGAHLEGPVLLPTDSRGDGPLLADDEGRSPRRRHARRPCSGSGNPLVGSGTGDGRWLGVAERKVTR